MNLEKYKEDDDILLSIIVPVYNVQNYLDDCLQSLLNQGFEKQNIKYEIICIDDGSTDMSLNILQRYEQDYSMIRVESKLNGGVSSARNEGLRKAKGKYITFVDADDYLVAHTLCPILMKMEKEKKQSCTFNFRYVKEEWHFTQESVKLEYEQEVSEYKTTPNVCGLVIPLSIIKEYDISFRENMKYGEDTLFQYYLSLYLSGKNHLLVKTGIYCYRQRTGSAMHQRSEISTLTHMNDMISMAKEYQKMCLTLEKGSLYNNTKCRQDKAVMAAMFDSAFVNNIRPGQLIQDLQKQHLYPIRFAWWTIKPNQSIKTWIINAICFCFPIRVYYYFFVMIIRCIKPCRR